MAWRRNRGDIGLSCAGECPNVEAYVMAEPVLAAKVPYTGTGEIANKPRR